MKELQPPSAAQIFRNFTEKEFENLALKVFRYQYTNNAVYKAFVNTIGIDTSTVNSLEQIPFLPIAFFKTHKVICNPPEVYSCVFFSSSTTTGTPSEHYVKDIELYTESFRKGFAQFYGDIKQCCILALLPSYLERKDSSLVFMVEQLIKDSKHPGSGFYMHNYDELTAKIRDNEASGQKTLLLGVTYALLDLAEAFPMELKNTIVMETGGMKGKREELTKQEVHRILSAAFKVENIHSEYGMTELLSQAYSKGKGIFQCPPWMKVKIRDIYDPFNVGLMNENGAINIIDLANIHSCSFIATDDIGFLFPDGQFEVRGRLDNSDIRGCNIMAD